MQESAPSSLWTHPLALIVATCLGFVLRHSYKWVVLFLGWKKPQAETDEITARTAKTYAEARQIHVRSDTEVSNVVLEVTARIMEIQERLESVTSERNELRGKLSLSDIEMANYELQLREMKTFIDSMGNRYGFKYSDKDNV